MKKILPIIIIFSFILSSCNAVRESAGVNRKVIDEYSVIENPPLVIPPNFNLLPPEQIKSKDIEDTESELAKEILFGLDNDETQTEKSVSVLKEIVERKQLKTKKKNLNKKLSITKKNDIKPKKEISIKRPLASSPKISNDICLKLKKCDIDSITSYLIKLSNEKNYPNISLQE